MGLFIGIAGGPRHGFTELYVGEVLRHIQTLSPDSSTRLISLAGKDIRSCDDCKACHKRDLKRLCKYNDDWFDIVKNFLDEDLAGLVVGTPVYTYSTTAIIRAFMERFTAFNQRQYFPDLHQEPPPDWSRVVSGVVAVGGGRNGGQEMAMSSLVNWLLTNGFPVVGAYPATSIGVSAYEPTGNTEVSDVRGLRLTRMLAKNMLALRTTMSSPPTVSPENYHAETDTTLIGTKIGRQNLTKGDHQ